MTAGNILKGLRVWLAGALLLAAAAPAAALQVGDKAPDFSLPSTGPNNVRLADFAGKKSVVLFFYVGAFTKA